MNHRSISREHAEFAEVDGALVVRDLKSANGVRVNGEDIEECGLEDGDIIEEFRPGYTLGDRLLRPAMVKVAKGAR